MAKPRQDDGLAVGRDQARRLMRHAKRTVQRRQPRHPVTTDRRQGDMVASPLLARPCAVAKSHQGWVEEITSGGTAAGWWSLGVRLDVSSRTVVGWAMRQRVDAAFVQEVVPRAWGRRQPTGGLIQHADRRSHWACGTDQAWIGAFGRRCRMSRQGDGLDHAVAERCVGRLQGERTSRRHDASRQEAWDEVIDDIEIFYHRKRWHTYVGYVGPHDFERLARVAELSVRSYLTITDTGGSAEWLDKLLEGTLAIISDDDTALTHECRESLLEKAWKSHWVS
jgi:putative transposase